MGQMEIRKFREQIPNECELNRNIEGALNKDWELNVKGPQSSTKWELVLGSLHP